MYIQHLRKLYFRRPITLLGMLELQVNRDQINTKLHSTSRTTEEVHPKSVNNLFHGTDDMHSILIQTDLLQILDR